MTAHISPADLRLLDTEPRILDLRLAEALGFAQARDIRKLIERNANELGQHGEVCATVAQTSPEGGRPGTEYWLNEAQALIICMLSRTDKAAAVRVVIVKVFMAWRRGHAPLAGRADEPRCEFPAADGPLAEHMAKIATIREARLVHGPRAAARLWRRLGLPAVTESVVYEADDGRACLARLLGEAVEPGVVPTADAIVRLVESAAEGSDTARMALKACGIAMTMLGDRDAFMVANRHPFLRDLFAGTPWADGRWREALLKLPGAVPSLKTVFDGRSTRCVTLPVDLVDTFSPPPETGGNVVPLHPQD